MSTTPLHVQNAQPSASRQLPPALVEAVRSQRAILFLGAGASHDAEDANGHHPPLAQELCDLISKKFFGSVLPGYSLMTVAEMVISSSGQNVVFEYIRTIFDPFLPSNAHKQIPSFRWRAIATTNYDLLIERAYNSVGKPNQTLVPFVKDSEPIEERLQQSVNPVCLLKLHGCLDHLHDTSVPLLLSHEHYDRYSSGRTRLFSRIIDLSHESPVIFCGYSLGDPHIRSLVYRLQHMDARRPTFYMVYPEARPIDIAFWSTLRVEVIASSFQSFMAALAVAIPEHARALPVPATVVERPIRRHFRVNATESALLAHALETDFLYVHPAMSYAPQDPRKFYEGYDTGWGAIAGKLDVERNITLDMLQTAVLDEASMTKARLHVLRGPAGSGKTISLKRMAWEASVLDQLALWLQPGGYLNKDALFELYDLVGKRIFLFVDRVALHHTRVDDVLRNATQRGIPITIVAAEQDGDWNVYCGQLQAVWRPNDFHTTNMSKPEIEALLELLDRHESLGLLKGKTRVEQTEAFENLAERQLLVALHEATRGKKFEDIIYDEYLSITSEGARRLYLDVCSLNRFAVPVRAGTISRISGIHFDDFERDFLGPLQNVVLTSKDPYTGDYQYRARHSRVARFVFEQACSTDDERLSQILRLIDGLDVGFTIDKKSLEELTRGRNVADHFFKAESAREIYEAAFQAFPGDAFLYQQAAIFELNHRTGDLFLAEDLARQARELDHRSNAIIHTQAEVARRRANDQTSPVLRDQFRRQAREFLSESSGRANSYVTGTRCKLLVDEVCDLRDQMHHDSRPLTVQLFVDKVKDAEAALARARQIFPDDPEFSQIEARLRTELDQDARALSALEKAWNANPRGSGVAVRLAGAYKERDGIEKAIGILEQALERNPDDKIVHLELARCMLQSSLPNSAAIEAHLSRSFGKNDSNFEARYMYAQFLFYIHKGAEALGAFQELDRTAPPEFRNSPEIRMTEVSRLLPRLEGRIVRKEATYLFVATTEYPAHLYANASLSPRVPWEQLSVGMLVNFSTTFSRRGPVAMDLSPGRLA